MPLPETIPVRFTEEEAEYLSVRPVRRQLLRIEQLVDLILSVTGKDPVRVAQILRAGSVVYHFYRYWWEGFEADTEALRALLARFPEDDPGRPFRAGECSAVLIESEGAGASSLLLPRELASRKRWFRRSSFWDALMELAERSSPVYQSYSYAHRADLFALPMESARKAFLSAQAVRLAPRDLHRQVRALATCHRLVFLCPRRPSRTG
ncbi:MAG: hypothetical protein K6U09_12280 [Acidobacteriia bacterium]|jgi:hypothetical protein|nr:hypothetical protein [Terriglobia bacterium]